MPVTGPTLIDKVESTTSSSTIVFTVPGGVPAGAMIFADVNTGQNAGGASDDGSNTYTEILNIDPGGGVNAVRYHAFVSTPLTSGEEITVVLAGSAGRRVGTAYYFEGLDAAPPTATDSATGESRPSANTPADDLALGFWAAQQDFPSFSATEDADFTNIDNATTGNVASPRAVNAAFRIPGSPEATTYDPTITDYVALATGLTVHAQPGTGGTRTNLSLLGVG